MTNANSTPNVTKPAVAPSVSPAAQPKVDTAKHESPAPRTKA